MTTTWTNWSKLQRATPARVETPWTTTELHRIVDEAVAQRRRIKAVGSGHSFTGIARADDIQLDLSNYTGILDIDPSCQQITVRTGTKLWDLAQLLTETGMAMENLGDINQQSVAGAISTSTHGTGVTFGGLASQVVGVEMLTGTGEILTVSEHHNAHLLDAVRVTLGALGIITNVTLQLVPEYDVHTVEALTDLDMVLEHWDALNTANDHFEFFWFGHDTQVLAKTSQRLPVKHAVPSLGASLRRTVLDDLITNSVLAGVCRIGRTNSAWVAPLNRLCTRFWGNSERTEHWSTGFTSRRRVRFNEMEYALPYEAVPEVVAELRQLFRREQISSTFPLEVRTAAPDTAWLASNHGRKTGYIAVHQHFGQDYRQYFSQVEPIFLAAGGRPHWGKLHTLDCHQLAPLYPHWDQMVALRDKLDPDRIFSNPYLTQVLGA